MAGNSESELKRCEEGHVFDVARHELCPTCGSPVAGRGRTAEPREAAAPEFSDESAAESAATASRASGTDVATPPEGLLAKLPAPLKGLRGLALAGGLLAAVLLVIAVLTSDDQGPGGSDPVTAVEPEDDPVSPVVVVRPDEEVEPPDPGDDFNPSTADPYGLWEMYTPVPGQAPFRHVIEIRPDTSYAVYAGPYSHAGTMSFTGRVYQLNSRTSAYQDAGAFFRPDPDTIVFEGRLGRTAWARVQQPALFDLSDSSPKVPANLPAALGRMTRNIQASWRADAVPVRFEVKGTRSGAYELEVSYISPQDRTGLAVTWGRFHTSEFAMGGVSWFDKPLPEDFVDLPEAYAAMSGVAPIKRAELGYFNRGGGGNTFDRNAPPGWLINPEAGQGGLVEAATR